MDIDCHHRAALVVNAIGVVGIQGFVRKVYATCDPVPPFPGGNSGVNDYVSSYTGDKTKWRMSGIGNLQKLMFMNNDFEGCLRVQDNSADGNAWWTVWPYGKHDTAKALLNWHPGVIQGTPQGVGPQIWVQGNQWIANQNIPNGLLDNPDNP